MAIKTKFALTDSGEEVEGVISFDYLSDVGRASSKDQVTWQSGNSMLARGSNYKKNTLDKYTIMYDNEDNSKQLYRFFEVERRSVNDEV